MLVRSLLIIGTFCALLIISGASLLSGSQLSTVTNWLLPSGWQVSTAQDGIHTHWQGASLARFSLSYQGCPLINADNIALHWQPAKRLSVDKATLNYQCLSRLPDSDGVQTSFSLASMLSLLPESQAEIKALHWVDLPATLAPRIQQLFADPSRVTFAFSRQKLTASLRQQAVKFEAEFANQTLSGKLDYQPNEQETHHLLFSAQLNDDVTTLPVQFKGDYHWLVPATRIADQALRKGHATLAWQTHEQKLHQGELSFTSETLPQNTLHLPFKFDHTGLEIQQGRFYWDWQEDFPLQGFVNAKLTPNDIAGGEYYPIKTYLRFSLLSQSKTAGKGTIVLENRAGEWQKDGLNLPLQMTGEVKYGNFILYSSLPIEFKGKFNDLNIKFQPKSLLRLVGKERLLTLHDLRFPLAGIQLNKHGVNGRLQARFKGESPDFKNIDVHLDGFAQNFKIGQLTFFEDFPGKNKAQDYWNWKLWGNTNIKSLTSKLNLSGRGDWHAKQIKLNELTGSLGKIHQKGVYIPRTELKLLEPIRFAYEKWHLDGGIQIKSPEIRFDYGGKIFSPETNLHVNGETENLNLKGEIRAGKIGPLKLFARRQLTQDSSKLIGRLYWHEQPAHIFQPLFPLRQGWLITGGTIRGETAFSASVDEGLIAGGHFTIRHASLSMPRGEASGIDFSLPYRLQHNELDFGLKKPLDLSIGKLDVGLPITQIKAKIFGHFPYRDKQPLVLQQLSMHLLDGRLNVEHFGLPQKQIAYLNLEQIDFERILELVQYKQVELKGKGNATLPFWLSGNPCYVCNGSLTQSGESNLKIQPELMDAIAQSSGYSERILLYLMNDTRITDLHSLINVGPKGDMLLNAKLKMRLNQQEKAQVNFNYNHKENVFNLWHLINSGTYIEQNIENAIYQKLDNAK